MSFFALLVVIYIGDVFSHKMEKYYCIDIKGVAIVGWIQEPLKFVKSTHVELKKGGSYFYYIYEGEFYDILCPMKNK